MFELRRALRRDFDDRPRKLLGSPSSIRPMCGYRCRLRACSRCLFAHPIQFVKWIVYEGIHSNDHRHAMGSYIGDVLLEIGKSFL